MNHLEETVMLRDRIYFLEAEIDKLKAALREIAAIEDSNGLSTQTLIARKALNPDA